MYDSTSDWVMPDPQKKEATPALERIWTTEPGAGPALLSSISTLHWFPGSLVPWTGLNRIHHNTAAAAAATTTIAPTTSPTTFKVLD